MLRFLFLIIAVVCSANLEAQTWPGADYTVPYNDGIGNGQIANLPMYNPRTVYVTPGSDTGPSITFQDWGRQEYFYDGCWVGSGRFRRADPVFYVDGNALNEDLNFVPRRNQAGGPVTIVMGAFLRVRETCTSSTDNHTVSNYGQFNINVEAPAFTENIIELSKICIDGTPIQISNYFEMGITGITFSIEDETGSVVSPNITYIDPTTLVAGNYTLVASKSYDNGNYREEFDFELVNKPVATITSSITGNMFCQGDFVTLSAPEAPPGQTYSYMWSTGETSREIVISATNSVTVTVSNGGCETTSDPVTYTMLPAPNANVTFLVGGEEICEGEQAIMTVPNAETFQWMDLDGNILGTSQTFTVDESGTYRVLVTNANDCSAVSAPINITVLENPIPTITPDGPTEFCEGESVRLTASLPNPLPVTYLWSNGESSQSIEVTESGVYSVTVYNPNNCTSQSETIEVTVKPNPVPEIIASGDLTFCQGGEVTLSATAASGYLWSTGETTQSITVSAPGNYYVTTITPDGCERRSEPAQVTVLPSVVPLITAIGSTDFCEGEFVTLQVTNAQAGVTYTWSNGVEGLQNTVGVTGSYYVIAENANGCAETSEPISVTVSPIQKPEVIASGPLDFCAGDSVVLSVTNIDGATGVRWSNGATGSSIIVKNSGNYIAYIEKGDCERGSDPVSVNVMTNQVPTIQALGPTEFCEGDSVTLSISNPQPGVTYTWSTGEQTYQIKARSSNQYYVIGENANGCASVSEPLEVVVSPIPKPTISADGDVNICLGDSVVLSVDQSGQSYRWSNGETTRSITVKSGGTYTAYITNEQGCERASDPVVVSVRDNRPVSISVFGNTTFCEGDSIVLTANQEGSYLWSNGATTRSITIKSSASVNVRVINEDNCEAISDFIDITVHPIPKPTISTTGPTEFCQGDSITLTIDQEAPSYRWSNGATTKSITIGSSQTVTAYITNDEGCERASDPVKVTVKPNPMPTINVSGETTFCEGDSVTLSVTPISGYIYTWSNGTTGTSTVVKNSGTVFVTSETPDGCSRTSEGIEIIAHPIPKPTVSASPSLEICEGDTVTLTIDQEAPSYRWSNGATTKTIKVTRSMNVVAFISNEEGCERASEPVHVIVKPNPKPTISVSGPLTFCEGDSVTLSVTPVAGNSYEWSNGDTGTSTVIKTGQTVYVTSLTPDGCSRLSDPVEVDVYPIPKPTVSVTGSLDFCEGDSVLLTVDQIAPSYRWSNGATTRSITVKSSISVIAFITNEEGCERESDAINVRVKPNPVPTIQVTGNTTFCDGDSVVLTASPGVSYLWSNGEESRTITVKNPGDYYVVVTNTEGCQRQSQSVSVTVIPNDVPAISSSNGSELCEGEFTTLTATEGKLYRWNTGETTRSIRVSKQGVYTVAVINENDCERVSLPFTINVHQATPLNGIPDQQICLNDEGLMLDSINPNEAGGAYTGEGIINKRFEPGQAGIGTHTIVYTFTNEYGCISTVDFVIEVIAPTELHPGADTTICENANDILLMIEGLPLGTEIEGPGVDGNRFVPSLAGVGTHRIIFTYSNTQSCASIATQLITVLPVPSAPVVTGNRPACDNTTLLLSATSNVLGNGNITYNWYREGETEPFATGREIRYVLEGSANIFVGATTGLCESTRTEVNVFSLTPDVRVSASATDVIQGTPVTFMLEDMPESNPSSKWQWDFGDGFTSSEKDPVHYYNKPGIYTVSVRAFSDDGCMAVWEETGLIKVALDSIEFEPPVIPDTPVVDDTPFHKTVIYPNPIRERKATLRAYNPDSTPYDAVLEIYTITSKLLSTQEVTVQPGQNEINVENLNRLVAKTYYLFVLRKGDGSFETIKILVL